MAKIIEFLAPVDAMRGVLSDGVKPGYGDNGAQKAWDQPGQAKVYSKRYVGSKLTSEGRNKRGFSIKARTSFNADMKSFCAYLGGAASMANKALHQIDILATLILIINALRNTGELGGKTGRGYLTKVFREMLVNKDQSVTLSAGGHTLVINNPWVSGGTGKDVTIPAEIISKFQSYLAA